MHCIQHVGVVTNLSKLPSVINCFKPPYRYVSRLSPFLADEKQSPKPRLPTQDIKSPRLNVKAALYEQFSHSYSHSMSQLQFKNLCSQSITQIPLLDTYHMTGSETLGWIQLDQAGQFEAVHRVNRGLPASADTSSLDRCHICLRVGNLTFVGVLQNLFGKLMDIAGL